ncbi:MAG: hypothetical protein U0X20_22065 [Caldilineaceae bacterium]
MTEQWVTPVDGKMCGRCWVLAGLYFPAGVGPRPPLHEGCRCRRMPVPPAQPERGHEVQRESLAV